MGLLPFLKIVFYLCARIYIIDGKNKPKNICWELYYERCFIGVELTILDAKLSLPVIQFSFITRPLRSKIILVQRCVLSLPSNKKIKSQDLFIHVQGHPAVYQLYYVRLGKVLPSLGEGGLENLK